MTFRQAAAGKGSRNGVVNPRTARCIRQGFFFRLLQQGDLIGIKAGGQAKMATGIAQLYQGPVDRWISVDGIERTASALKRFRAQLSPIDALSMQVVLPHDIDRV